MDITERKSINQYHKAHNERYRKENQAKLKERFECPCGKTYSYGNKASHCRSKHHQRFIKYPIKLYNVQMPSEYYLNKLKQLIE